MMVVLIGIMLIACSPKEEAVTVTVVETAPGSEVIYTTVNSVYNLISYKKAEDGSFTLGSVRLSLGEPISYMGETEEVSSDKINKILSHIKNKKGEDVWIDDIFLVPDGRLGVIIGEPFVYSEPDILQPTDDILPKGTIVTIYPDEENGFKKITTWDEVNDKRQPNVFVKKATVSSKEADVQTGLILFAVGKSKNDAVKMELLRSALDYSSKVFANEIDNEIMKINGSANTEPESESAPVTQVEVPIEDFYFSGIINDNDVNVRNIPSTNGSSVVSQLNNGESVMILAQTVEDFTIGADTSKWYKLEDPEGWIFGIFVDAQ